MAKTNYIVMEDGSETAILSTANLAEAKFVFFRNILRGKTMVIKTNSEPIGTKMTPNDLKVIEDYLETPVTKCIGMEILFSLIERLEDPFLTPVLHPKKGVISGKQSELISRLAVKLFTGSNIKFQTYFKKYWRLEVFPVKEITSGLIFTKRGIIKF